MASLVLGDLNTRVIINIKCECTLILTKLAHTTWNLTKDETPKIPTLLRLIHNNNNNRTAHCVGGGGISFVSAAATAAAVVVVVGFSQTNQQKQSLLEFHSLVRWWVLVHSSTRAPSSSRLLVASNVQGWKRTTKVDYGEAWNSVRGGL